MNFLRILSSLLLVLVLTQHIFPQLHFYGDMLDKVEFLRSDSSAVEELFSKDTFTTLNDPGQSIFYRFSENVYVSYSSGECNDAIVDDSDWIYGFLGPDVWNVPAGKIVRVTFEPKAPVPLRDLGINLAKYKRERLYRIYRDYFVYFSKSEGIAIKAWGDQVESITFSPPSEHFRYLCDSPIVRKHYSNDKWRVISEKNKDYCVLFNKPANVRNVSVLSSEEENRFKIVVTADDPENDVLTFIYLVSGGRITSKGANATWDLSAERPGTYEIKVAADDGSGPRGLWASEKITIN